MQSMHIYINPFFIIIIVVTQPQLCSSLVTYIYKDKLVSIYSLLWLYECNGKRVKMILLFYKLFSILRIMELWVFFFCVVAFADCLHGVHSLTHVCESGQDCYAPRHYFMVGNCFYSWCFFSVYFFLLY